MSISGVVRLGRSAVGGAANNNKGPRSVLTFTDAAVQRLKEICAKRDPPVAGLRLSLKKRGCSGMAYTLDFVQEKQKHDEVVEADGVSVFVDPRALMHVIGTEMDFTGDLLQSGFVFTNPNATGACGCGESFSVSNTLSKNIELEDTPLNGKETSRA
ncbi:FeS cluster biogenesis [Balamuthia mandrillaris]